MGTTTGCQEELHYPSAVLTTMKVFIVAITLALVGLATAGVVELEVGTFPVQVVGGKPHLVMFGAPWDGHSRMLLDHLGLLADKISKEGTSLAIANVDCSLKPNVALCGEEGVAGYPTLKLYKSGRDGSVTYNDINRMVGNLYKFVQEQLG